MEDWVKASGGDPVALNLVLNTFADTPVEALARIQVPTLILTGAADGHNATGEARRCAAAMATTSNCPVITSPPSPRRSSRRRWPASSPAAAPPAGRGGSTGRTTRRNAAGAWRAPAGPAPPAARGASCSRIRSASSTPETNASCSTGITEPAMKPADPPLPEGFRPGREHDAGRESRTGRRRADRHQGFSERWPDGPADWPVG